MEKKNYSKTSPEVIELKTQIEVTSNMKVRTPADFTYLAGLISGKTGDILSPTTLKRLWGYIEGADVTRPSTLNILARYIGFQNWDDFVDNLNNSFESQSRVLLNGSINTDDLNLNDQLEIEWKPNRHIVVRYMGNMKFEVINAVNSKVSVGDTFECGYFLMKEPLYVDKLIHDGGDPVPFVMGTRDGLTSIKKI